jgi:Flp pilus assembly pilin Flp
MIVFASLVAAAGLRPLGTSVGGFFNAISTAFQ